MVSRVRVRESGNDLGSRRKFHFGPARLLVGNFPLFILRTVFRSLVTWAPGRDL
jgi:hypothetical protein